MAFGVNTVMRPSCLTETQPYIHAAHDEPVRAKRMTCYTTDILGVAFLEVGKAAMGFCECSEIDVSKAPQRTCTKLYYARDEAKHPDGDRLGTDRVASYSLCKRLHCGRC